MPRLVRKQVYITAEQEERLKEVASREKRSEADVIRAALDDRLSPRRKAPRGERRDALWRIVAVASAAPDDVSEHVDEHLYGPSRR
jgi:hypothetical protein